MNEQGDYTPNTRGAVECPACDRVVATLPVEHLPCQVILLTAVECPHCGQYWEDLRHLGDGWAKRYWAPEPSPPA